MYGITYMVKCIIMRWRRTQILTHASLPKPAGNDLELRTGVCQQQVTTFSSEL